MSKVFPMLFDWLSQAERIRDKLNEIDTDGSEKWICMPLVTYIGPVHTAVNKEVHNEKEVLQNII
jgi:hypothetical protein